MIKGFDIAVGYLTVGNRATFFIPSQVAYGKIGQAPDIMGDQDLIVQIELLSIRDVDETSIVLMNDESRVTSA